MHKARKTTIKNVLKGIQFIHLCNDTAKGKESRRRSGAGFRGGGIGGKRISCSAGKARFLKTSSTTTPPLVYRQLRPGLYLRRKDANVKTNMSTTQ